jgi:hybrid cluster-associated redox disulfide protein
MSETRIDPSLSVDEVMRRWPATIAVFIRHRMACVGCAIGPFHSIEDGSIEHDIPLTRLLAELEAAIRDA